MRLSRSVAICAGFLGILVADASVAQQKIIDSTVVELDAQVRVNLAGRQRMLSQRMSKSVCLLNRGIETETQISILNASRNDFSVVLKALGTKNEEIGLVNQETSSRVLRGIAEVEDIWSRFDSAVGAMIELGEFSDEKADVVYTESDPLLSTMNDLVSTIEQMHADPSVMMAAQGVALNIAGRQRMLTQKMGKELCQVLADWNDAATREKLQRTMKMFEVSHKALAEGNAAVGIVAPPTAEIETALEALGAEWVTLRPIVQKAIDGSALTPGDVATYARDGDTLLKNMNAIVGLYEKI